MNTNFKYKVLEEFFRANRSEVIEMSIFEFDREEHEKIIRAEEEARGKKQGRIEGMFKTLYELVRDNILSLKIAASKAGQTEEEFTTGMEAYFALPDAMRW